MRHNIIKKIGLFFLLAVVISSCEKWIDTDINISPNNPGDVTLNVLLSSSQAGIAYHYGGELTRYQAMWMQHLSGVTRQSFATERYSVLDSDINNLWNSLYGVVLMNLQVIDEKAEAQNAPHYFGVSKVLQAYTLLNITSVWGDVPFSDAFKAAEKVTKPAYDNQDAVFSTINKLLDDAILLFGEASPAGNPTPGADDIIYKGNIPKWTKLAHTLKVRAALHLSKRNGMGSVRDLINAGGLIAGGDDFQFNFGAASNEWNPRHQFDNDRGDVRVGARIVDLMNQTNDPRLAVYFTNTAAGYVGSAPGAAADTASFVGSAYASQDSPVFLLTYFELKFIEAEAFFGNDNARSATAYNEAVVASLAKHGVSDANWEALHANEDASTISLEKIMTGKYIAMFYSLETWTDWRRTGLPTLALPANNALPETPRRYLYPLDENLYNTANVPAHTATSRVWWDN